MLARPRFKPHLHLAVVPHEGIFVLCGARQTLLRGRLYELVAPRVDGRSADEICDQLAPEASAAEVYYTLAQLEKKGYLAEADENLPLSESAWWSLQDLNPQTAAQRLVESRIAVHGVGVDPQPLCDLLDASGVTVNGAGDDAGELTVVLVDHYLRPQLKDYNDAALASGRPWLIVKPWGGQIWLGPLFRPGRSGGCWQCLAERLRSNRPVESYLLDRESLAKPLAVDEARTTASSQVALGLAVNAITAWIVRGEIPECEGSVRTFDQFSWQSQTHALAKLPFCPVCGGLSTDDKVSGHVVNGHSVNGYEMSGHEMNRHAANGRPANPEADGGRFRPLVLESRKKTFVRDGGHRVVHPQTTIDRFGHHVSPITGAVSMLERTTPVGDGSLHVYMAGQNLARRHHSLGHLQNDLRNMSAGKGTTDVQAKASGLCEGLERYSGVFRGDESRRTARMADLGSAAIDLSDCLLFSERQFRERETINAGDSPYSFVPLPFDPTAEIDWSPVWSLSRHEKRYLPTAFCYYDCPQPKAQRFCIADSNGCAAGNTVEEAVLQGFLELVERDSVALWWYNRLRRPGVDLDSFDEPYLRDLVDCLATHDREMCALDLTSDLAIPVFVVWSRRTRGGSGPDSAEQIVMGFGAHLDPKIALLRAATEMNQMLSYLLQAPPDKIYSDHVTDRETVRWLKTATAENQPYLLPDTAAAPCAATCYTLAATDDIAQDVNECRSLVERQGLEMLVLNQTRPEVGLPVVKVIVPGLRHFWTRFAPGRLYDVPVKMGWRQEPLTEEELNPIPMFL